MGLLGLFLLYGGFLSHRGTEINHPASLGYPPPILGNLHDWNNHCCTLIIYPAHILGVGYMFHVPLCLHKMQIVQLLKPPGEFLVLDATNSELQSLWMISRTLLWSIIINWFKMIWSVNQHTLISSLWITIFHQNPPRLLVPTKTRTSWHKHGPGSSYSRWPKVLLSNHVRSIHLSSVQHPWINSIESWLVNIEIPLLDFYNPE